MTPREEFLIDQDRFRSNALEIILQMLEWLKQLSGSKHLVDEILHSIFFLGKINNITFKPENIIANEEMLYRLNQRYPGPLQHYESQLPKRSPFSCVLDMIVLQERQRQEGQSEIERIKNRLQQFTLQVLTSILQNVTLPKFTENQQTFTSYLEKSTLEEFTKSLKRFQNNMKTFSKNQKEDTSSLETLKGNCQEFNSNVQNFNSNVKNIKTSLTTFASSVQEFSSSVQEFSSSVQEFNSRLQIFSSSLEKFNNSKQVFKWSKVESSLENVKLSRENVERSLSKVISSLNKDESSLQEFSNELPRFARGLEEFTSKLKDFTGSLEEFENSLKEFTSSLQEFTNSLRPDYLFSTTMCVTTCNATKDNYYGVSMSGTGPYARQILIAASCLSFWHDYVAGAVMTYYPENANEKPEDVRQKSYFDGTIQLPPDMVTCKASNIKKKTNTDPCRLCRELFGLTINDTPADTREALQWFYGNCAEAESLSKFLKKKATVRGVVRAAVTSPTYTADRQRAVDSVRQVLKELLRRVAFEWVDDQFYQPQRA